MDQKKFREQGLVYAPAWVIDKYMATEGNFSVELREALDIDLYPDDTTKPNDEIFQKYWVELTSKHHFQSQWNKNFIEGHCGILFENRKMVDYYYKYESQNGSEKVNNYIKNEINVIGPSNIEIGIVSSICKRGTTDSFPGFTLFVSGPNGGSEAARVFKKALEEYGIAGGLFMRSTENDRFGVIQGVFSTIWYSYQGGVNFGIDWNVWNQTKNNSYELHLYDAVLYWTDYIIFILKDLMAKAGNFIDAIYLDSFKISEYHNCSSTAILRDLSV